MDATASHQDSSPAAAARALPAGTGVLVLVCAAQFMVVLDVSIVNVALPSMREALGFSAAGLQWVVNAYTVAFGGLLLLGGRAGDLLGRKAMFVAGLAVFGGASLLGGLAQGDGTLIAARALQGVGAAVVAPATLALLTTSFPEGRPRARAFAAWGAVAAGGGATGALLGGLLTDALSWRWIFLVNVPIGVVLAWAALRRLPADPPRGPRRAAARSFDLAGAVTGTLGLGLLVLGVVRTEGAGWLSAPTLGTLAAGAASLAAFLAIEARARSPLMPLRVLAAPRLAAANASIFLLGCSMFAMWFVLSLYLQQVLDLSALETGLAFLPQTIALALASTQAGRVVSRYGIRPTVIAGFALSAAGLWLLAGARPDGGFWTDVLVPSVVLTTGMGLCMVPLTTAAVSETAGGDAGLASGLAIVSRMAGGAIGLAVLVTAASARTADALGGAGRVPDAVLEAALTEGYRLAFLGAGAFAAAGALVVALSLREPAAPAPARA